MKELWDIVDEHGRRTGRTICAGEKMNAGDYHPAVSVWVRNSQGEYLISQRAPDMGSAAGMWDTTSGSVVAGEESLQAAVRETKEELGVDLDPASAHHFCSYTWPMSDGNGAVYYDVWLFLCDISAGSIRLQEGETADAAWTDADGIRRMITEGRFIPYNYIEELFAAQI